VRALCDSVCGDAVPGLTFYLDVDPIVGLQRTRKAAKEDAAEGQMDRIESEALAFHRSVREAFLAMAQREPERIVVIDASKPLEDVSAALLNALKERMGFART
jgi:dTMP kinase